MSKKGEKLQKFVNDQMLQQKVTSEQMQKAKENTSNILRNLGVQKVRYDLTVCEELGIEQW